MLSPSGAQMTWTIVKAAVAVGFAVVLASFMMRDKDADGGTAVPMAGTLATLGGECPAMPTQDGWEQFSSAIGQNDHAGAARLILDHGGAFLPAKTEIMVKAWYFPGAVEASIQTGGVHYGERLFLSWSCASRGAK